MISLIGVPYQNGGRDLRGADCYGLLMLYYKKILNINVPDVAVNATDVKGTFNEYLRQISKHWQRILLPEKHCGVAMCLNEMHPKLVSHFGVMIDNERILQTYEKTNSHIIKVDSPSIRNQIKGFYRWHS